MNVSSYAISDSLTMLGRDLRHARRYPLMTISSIFLPLLMLLIFVEVLGGTMRAGLGIGSYINYVAPAIIIMAVCAGASQTAVNVSTDMTDGIIARFRTMAIFRPSVLVGTVIGSVIRTLLSIALVAGVAILMGFRPAADTMGWVAAIAVIVLLTFAIQWLAVAIGLVSKSAGAANTATLPLQLGTYISSAFVDPASMSPVCRWFAKNQPFTPIIDTIRGLLMGTPVGHSGIIAIAWCVAIALIGFVWASAVYNREPIQ